MGYSDLFIFMIVALILVLFSGVFIYMSGEVLDELRTNIDDVGLVGDGNDNASTVLENTLGSATDSFDALYWIATFLIFGMIMAIFIGSYMVTTKPIFFIPYIFVVIIAIVVAVPMSNAYETLSSDVTLQSTFANFIGSNWIMANLPVIIAIVGITGGIIMFVRMGKREEAYYGY